ncbi:MAG: phosphoribosylglycinamide formyltransferase [Bacteroidetes bacterium GWF2_40_14]|nr:MAG: phosphoribosylglycinamide formyltransferase [Bacteroidetes bacterium GWF2_40_14]
MSPIKIAIFASGSGTNAENIVRYFKDSTLCRVDLILSNKNDAYVLERARQLGVESFVFSAHELGETDIVNDLLDKKGIDYIILAGFLLKIPNNLLANFPSKIINIHPALLPSYGGKGMYGMNVHKAVVEAGEKESGITIHLVDEHYDNGKILFRAVCPVYPGETPDSLAEKIHVLEYDHYPKVIEKFLMDISK